MREEVRGDFVHALALVQLVEPEVDCLESEGGCRGRGAGGGGGGGGVEGAAAAPSWRCGGCRGASVEVALSTQVGEVAGGEEGRGSVDRG